MSHEEREHENLAEAVDAPFVAIHASRVATHDASVVLRYEPAIRKFCRSRTYSPEDADDAVQDTFLRYLRRSERAIRNDEAWLITAASRACADINRRRKREESRRAWPVLRDGELENRIDHTPAPRTTTDPEQITVDHLTVSELLRQLSSRDRVVVTHLYLLGASQQQVAEYLGVTHEHLWVIAMRARRHAQAILHRIDAMRPA
jgi:RNA polymerase sigma factor (sigma-70 family)